jgi:hypothetical protein
MGRIFLIQAVLFVKIDLVNEAESDFLTLFGDGGYDTKLLSSNSYF